MKNKRLVVLLSIFLVITVLIVLCSTVFTLHTVDIVWLTSTNNLNNATKESIMAAGNIKTGESVFLLNKEEYKNNIEKNLPYAQIISLEIGFPNKLTIKLSEREELYVLKVVNSKNTNQYSYVYLDYDLKVLKIVNSPVDANGTNPAILQIENYNLTDANFEVGTYASMPVNNALISIGNMLASTGFGGTNANALIESMVLNYSYKSEIIIKTTYGLTLKLEDALQKTSQKMLKALSVYEEYHNNHPEINAGVITVYENNGIIVASAPQV